MTDAEKAREAMLGGSALIVEGSPESRFAMVPNELCDPRSPHRVGAAAAGYWMAIKSKPPAWRFSFAGFESTCAEGKAAVRRGLDELEAHGWLLRLQPKGAGGKFGSGALWVLLHDPGAYHATLARYLSAGFVKSSKHEPPRELAGGVPPTPETSPRAVDNIVENDVENPCAEKCEERPAMGGRAQNPRSEPMYHFSDIGETDTIKYINKYKNKKSAATQRSCAPAAAPGSSDAAERFLALERVYPRPSAGEARDKAFRAFSALIDSGVPADDVVAAAGRFAASAAERKTPRRYIPSLLTFLADPKGLEAWRPAAGGGEADRRAVLEAYRRGRASDADLVPAWAEQSRDPCVSAVWARLSEALEADPRLDAHEEYDALRRMAHSAPRFGDFARFAARRVDGRNAR